MKVTPANWTRCVICLKRAKANCCKNTTSGSQSERVYVPSAIKSVPVIAMCCHRLVGLVLGSIASEDSSEELMSKPQLLYEDVREGLVWDLSTLQLARNSPLVCKLESQTVGNEIERMATAVAADASKQELDALKFRYSKSDFKVTRLHS